VDDILSRLGHVEKSVTKIEATLPHLATAASVAELRSELTNEIKGVTTVIPHLATAESVAKIAAIIPHLATAASVMAMEAKISAMESKIIKWFVGTAIALTTLAFSIARFVH
jgi:hypothetical protein